MPDNVQPQTPVMIFDEFLVAEEWRMLVDFTLGNTGLFTATQVIGANGDSHHDYHTRRSRVLYDLGTYQQVFSNRLMAFLPHVLTRLGRPWFPVSWIEIQLTATNHGEYFRTHADSGSGEASSRFITFVYFFHREPRAFGGGELRIYDTQATNDHASPSGPFRTVYPLQNQVIFFPSECLHEVMPVNCPSADFADSRFTVNGWLHR